MRRVALVFIIAFVWTGIAIAGAGLKAVPVPYNTKIRVRKFPDQQCQYYQHQSSIKAGWLTQSGVTSYTVRLATMGEPTVYGDPVTVTILEATLPSPGAGKYFVQMKPSNSESWIFSLDSANAVVDNRPACWWVYFK